MNQIEHICYNCRWCKEDGGEGEDCGTYYVCRRTTPWRLTQPDSRCCGFRPLPWLVREGSEYSQRQTVSISQPDAAGGYW